MSTETGKLYLVATPLGNLEDITYRALKVLAEVDLIAAEDTRHTLKLLNHFGIKQRMTSYYQHNERERSGEIIDKLRSGLNVALVSDAGTPGISDPGCYLVAEAIVTALAASGLPTNVFWFQGFLPRKVKEQAGILTDLAKVKGTLVFYESPHRLEATLKNIYEVLGDREAVLARELTKIHEEFIRGSLSEIISRVEKDTLKGEFTVLVGGATAEKNRQNSTNQTNCNNVTDGNEGELSLRQKLRKIAEETGKNTKEVYQIYLSEKGKK